MKVQAVGDTMVGRHTKQHLLERSEKAAIIFTVLQTKADYPAGHILACKFCFAVLFNLICFHSHLIKKNKVQTLFDHQKFFGEHQNSIRSELP